MAPLRPKFYFLAPTTSSPVNGPIFLGGIITHPRNADCPLNSSPVQLDPVTTPVYETEIHNYSVTMGKDRSTNMGIWASFLANVFGVGGSIDGTVGNEDSETWEIGKLKTLSFKPTIEYIQKSLENSSVQDFLTADPNWLRSSRLYMITGLKLAYDAKGAVSWAKSHGVNLQPGLDATPFAVPLEIGPLIGFSRRNNAQETYGDMTPFVLAFRMQKVKVSSSGEIKDTTVTGGMLGLEASKRDDAHCTQEKVIYNVQGLDFDDAGADEFQIDDVWQVEDETEINSETCRCSLVQ